jgi:hypothetical protein
MEFSVKNAATSIKEVTSFQEITQLIDFYYKSYLKVPTVSKSFQVLIETQDKAKTEHGITDSSSLWVGKYKMFHNNILNINLNANQIRVINSVTNSTTL